MHINLPLEVQNEADLDSLIDSLSTEQASKLTKAFWLVNSRLSQQPEYTDAVVKELTTIVKNAPSITLTFAQSGDEQFFAAMTDWLRSKIHHHMLVNFLVDPLLTGGCVVRTAQHQYDWSWSKLLYNNKNQLQKAISHVG